MKVLQIDVEQNRSHTFLVLASPILIVLIGHYAAHRA